MLRMPRKMTVDTSKVLRLPRKLQVILRKRRKSIAQRLSTRYKARLNVRKCHACHAKRSNTTCETSKSDPFCRTYHRHGHTGLARTVADGCERLQTVANGCKRLQTVCEHKRNVERTHPQPTDPQSETGTLAMHSGKNVMP